ncbi:cytochrome P450 [Mycena floridula]|nr:cytochrome P450 [Mycena floridula]
MDPKAIAHFYARGEAVYTQTPAARTFIARLVRKEQKIEGPQSGDKSVIGALIKSMSTGADMYLSQEEIQGQNTLLIAGYVTTADQADASSTRTVSMTALIELARAPDKQKKLREELLNLGPNDATYDQLSSPTTLPYLRVDAAVHEILRLHPAVPETARLCNQNDIVPLSAPITTRNGEVVNTIAIPKGRQNFALTEFKSVLSLIIRHYEFELPDGPKTKIGQWGGLIVKPNSEGEVDGKVPMIVRRVH